MVKSVVEESVLGAEALLVGKVVWLKGVVELGVVIRVSRFVEVAPVLMEQCHQYGSLEAYV